MATFDCRVLVERFTFPNTLIHRGDPIDVYRPDPTLVGTRCPSQILLHIFGIPSNYPTRQQSFDEFERQITGIWMDTESPNSIEVLRYARYRFRLGMIPQPQRQAMIDTGGISLQWFQARTILGFKVVDETDRKDKLKESYIDVGDGDL